VSPTYRRGSGGADFDVRHGSATARMFLTTFDPLCSMVLPHKNTPWRREQHEMSRRHDGESFVAPETHHPQPLQQRCTSMFGSGIPPHHVGSTVRTSSLSGSWTLRSPTYPYSSWRVGSTRSDEDTPEDAEENDRKVLPPIPHKDHKVMAFGYFNHPYFFKLVRVSSEWGRRRTKGAHEDY